MYVCMHVYMGGRRYPGIDLYVMRYSGVLEMAPKTYIYIYIYAADPRRKGLKRREGGRESEREGPRKPQ